MTDRIISIYGSLADVPSDFQGQARIENANYIATVDATATRRIVHGSSDDIAYRPSATELGKGSWQVGDILYVNKAGEWRTTDTVKSLLRTKGITIQRFPSGTTDLNVNTAGSGAVITTDADGGINVKQNTGSKVSSIIGFDCTPFTLAADTVIGFIIHYKSGYINQESTLYATTQASNYVGHLKKNLNTPRSANIPFEGDRKGFFWIDGTTLASGKFGDLSIDIGTAIDRMKIQMYLSAGMEVRVEKIIINPMCDTAIPLVFDDIHSSHYTEAFQYLSSKGLKATLAMQWNQLDTVDSMTTEHVLEVYEAGWDVVNHSYSHRMALSGYGAASPGIAGPINQICLSQTGTAGTPLLLNGTIGGTVFDAPRHLVLKSVSIEIPTLFTIVGLDANGNSVTINDSGNTAAASLLSFIEWTRIDSITPSSNTVGAINIGVSLSYDEMFSEINTCKQGLLSLGITRGSDIFVSPSGEVTPIVTRVCSDLGITKIRVSQPSTVNYDNPFVVPHPTLMSATGGGIAAGQSAILIAAKDLAITRRAPLIVYLHDIQAGGTAVADFRLLVDNLAASEKARDITMPVLSEYCRSIGY